MKFLAQSLNIPTKGGSATITGPATGIANLGTLVGNAIPIVLGLAGFALLLMIIRAGFTLLTSAGDAKKTESGKQQLTWAVAGFVVVFSAYWLVQILGTIFGLPEFKASFGG